MDFIQRIRSQRREVTSVCNSTGGNFRYVKQLCRVRRKKNERQTITVKDAELLLNVGAHFPVEVPTIR